MSDTISFGSDELPDFLKTLAGVLPQFTGADLEAQLQTYDSFIDMGCDRFKVAELLAGAATKTTDAKARARIEWAVQNIRMAGRAAAPYDHAEAMAEYMKKFRAPAAPVDAKAKREHPKILKKLDEIEAEMRKINFWAEAPPAEFVAKIAKEGGTSYMESPTFELWLQCDFIPRARVAAADDALPQDSMISVAAMRQYEYMSSVDAGELPRLLSEFDELVGLASVGGA